MFSQVNNEHDHNFLIPNEFVLKDNSAELIYFRLNLKSIKLYFSVHRRDELIQNEEKYTFNDYLFNETGHMFLTYDKIIIHSLPEPYETNCFDFQKKGFRSSLHCITECRFRLLSQQFPGKWIGSYLTNESVDQIMITPKEMFEEFEDNNTLDQNISDKCKDFCGFQRECYSEYYKLEVKPYVKNYGEPYICIYAPDIPDLVYMYLPKIYFIEFVLFVASSVSLWFGFSVLMLSDVIMKLYLVIKNKLNIQIINISKISINFRPKLFVTQNRISN